MTDNEWRFRQSLAAPLALLGIGDGGGRMRTMTRICFCSAASDASSKKRLRSTASHLLNRTVQ
jgi:hypothetical protein